MIRKIKEMLFYTTIIGASCIISAAIGKGISNVNEQKRREYAI